MGNDTKKFRYKMVIEYAGAGYSGWQRQGHCLTIQQVLEDALLEFTKEDVEIFAAGRTDAGVNALGQVAHFDLPFELDPYRLTGSLNYFMRGQRIGILSIERVSNDFHARFSAKQRHYVYKILNRRAICIIDSAHKTHIREELDTDKMQEGANHLLGLHDFSSFRSSVCQASTPIKTMNKIKVERCGEDIEVHFSALSFMHHMVRNIMGSLIYVGNGKWQHEHIKKVLEARDRRVCGPTAPPTGLYFAHIDY